MKEKEKTSNNSNLFGWVWNTATSYAPSWGSSNSSLPNNTEEEKINPLLMKELYETIEYNENENINKTQLPKDYVNLKINFNMAKGFIDIRSDNNSSSQNIPNHNDHFHKNQMNSDNGSKNDKDSRDDNGSKNDKDSRDDNGSKNESLHSSFLKSVFNKFSFSLLLMQESKVIHSSLHSCYITDSNTLDGKELTVLSPHFSSSSSPSSSPSFFPPPPSNKDKSEQESLEGKIKQKIEKQFLDNSPLIDNKKTEEINLWEMQIEINPIKKEEKREKEGEEEKEEKIDYKVSIQSQPVNLLFSKPTVINIIQFFDENEGSSTYKEIRMYARDSVEAVKKQTKMQLLNALQKKKRFEIFVDIKAPIIWIPEDFYSPNFSMMVFIPGNILIKNENLSSVSLQQIREQTSFESDKFYEKFNLLIKKLSVHMKEVNVEKEGWDWGKIDFNQLHTHLFSQLIQPFDLHFSLQHCLIESNDLPTFRIAASLPLLKTSFTSHQFVKFVQIARMIVYDEQEEEQIYQSSFQSSNFTPSNPSSSSSFSHQNNRKGDLLVSFPEREIMEIEKETVDSQFNQLYKENVELILNFSKFEVLLKHNQTKKEIVEIGFRGFTIKFVKRMIDWHATLSIKEFVMEDRQQTYGEQFKYMASTPQQSENEIISIKYQYFSPLSPNYQQIDHFVDWHFTFFDWSFNRETFVTLIDFANDVLDKISSKKILSQTKPNQNFQLFLEEHSKKEIEETGENTFLKLVFHFEGLKLNLNKKGKTISQINLSNVLSTLFVRRNNTIKITLHLGSIELNDLRSNSPKWKNIFHFKDLSPLHFNHFVYQTYNSITKTDGNFYNTFFSLSLNSIRFVYLQDFVSEFFSYFTDISEMYDILVSSYTYAANAASVKGEARIPFLSFLFLFYPYFL